MRSVTKRSYRVAEGDGAPLAPPAALALAQVAATRALRTPDIDLGTRSELEIQVQRLATSHPETVAEVVQSWLRED
jgi:flagellar biosynthesis/type III secretory pathway M-ring protein FliF/YscJ